jgi:F-type H+-transporting ATPase subunit a
MASEQTPDGQAPNQKSSSDAHTTESAAQVRVDEWVEVAAAPGSEIAMIEAKTQAELAAMAVPAEEKKGFFGRIGDYARNNPWKFGMYVAIILALIIGFFWPDVPEPHVALGGEPISLHTPWWLTNSVVVTLIVDAILILTALLVSARMKLVPSGLQNFVEMVLEYVYGLAEQIAGKAARSFFPWVMTIFLLVILSNWSGLIPGVGSIGYVISHSAEHEEEQGGEEGRLAGQLAMANGSLILISPEERAVQAETAEGEGTHFVPLFRAPSADLNLTFALAIATMVMVQIWGVRSLGGSYFKKFFNLSGQGMMKPIFFFVGILELISEFARIISFGFRLFGNIFAGEIVLATMAFLAAFVMPMPFYILEMFVGFVQALVFTMLALVFFSMATVGHGDSHAEH